MTRVGFAPSWLILSLFSLGGCVSGPQIEMASEDEYRISSRTIPDQYRRAYDFLEFIKMPEPTGAFDVNAAPRWDVRRLVSFVSKNGVLFTDVNGRRDERVAWPSFATSLSRRKGRVYRTFSHLSHIYSTPYRQYSELTFEPTTSGVIVHVSNWYALTFAEEAGELQLARCDYLTLEED